MPMPEPCSVRRLQPEYDLEQAVLLLRRPPVAGGRLGATTASRASSRSEPRLDHLNNADINLHARQVGIPLVRGLGPGFSLRSAGTHRR